MKKLSDYKGEDAIDLWADLLEPMSDIFSDAEVAKVVASGASKMMIAKTILKTHKKEAEAMMLRIDPEPLNGLNIILRLIAILADIGEHEEIKSFFGFAEQESEEGKSSISVTENTEDAKN